MKSESLLFSFLHLLMTLLLPLFIFVFVGCLEKPEAKLADLGVENSPDDVEFALSKATYGKTAYSMKVGERVDYEINIRIENEDITKVSDIAQQVTDKIEDANNIKYVLHERTNNYANGKVDTVEREFYINLEKSAPEAIAFQSPLAYFGLGTVKPMADEPIRVSFHNLKVTDVTVPVPDRVAMQPNCLGLTNCELKGTNITFTKAEWYSSTTRDITRYNFTFSPEAPYLGVALNGCLNFLYKANGREYLVTQCQVLRDFRFQ